MLTQMRNWYATHPPEMGFEATTEGNLQAWQNRARKRVRKVLGIDRIVREEFCHLEYETGERFEDEKYTGERVLVRTQPDMWVPAWVLIPKGRKPPYPAIMCLHGHAMSKDVMIGKPTSDEEAKFLKQFQGDYGRKFSEAGYLCFCPDSRGFGERSEEHGCQQIYGNAAAVGQDLQGLRVWDHLRCLDYVFDREDVDEERIGAVGLSMGCEHTMYLSALDERVRACVMSCCMRNLREEIHDQVHCICSYIPGIFRAFDWPDIGCLIAPRPALVQQGIHDRIPMELVEKAVEKMRKAYGILEAEDRVGTDFFDGGHEFNFAPALEWMDRWMRS